jgi:hypothetical protein
MSTTGVGPLELLAAALRRGADGDADEISSEPTERRYGELQPPSNARLYGPHGLLADERPVGGSGSAAVVRDEEGVLARQPGPAVDLGRLPRAPLPDEAAGVGRAAEQRTRLADQQEQRLAARRADRVDKERARIDERAGTKQPAAEETEVSRRGVERYLEVERGKLALPMPLSPQVGSGRYSQQQDDEAGAVRRKPAPSPARSVERDED